MISKNLNGFILLEFHIRFEKLKEINVSSLSAADLETAGGTFFAQCLDKIVSVSLCK